MMGLFGVPANFQSVCQKAIRQLIPFQLASSHVARFFHPQRSWKTRKSGPSTKSFLLHIFAPCAQHICQPIFRFAPFKPLLLALQELLIDSPPGLTGQTSGLAALTRDILPLVSCRVVCTEAERLVIAPSLFCWFLCVDLDKPEASSLIRGRLMDDGIIGYEEPNKVFYCEQGMGNSADLER